MKNLILILSILIFLFSCTRQKKNREIIYRENFSSHDSLVLNSARKIITDCYYGTLITIDENEQVKARVMEPLAPDNNFVIWMATNPRSRKVVELKINTKATMHYFSKRLMAYVSLIGKAELVYDKKSKQKYWKEGWERFYPDRKKDYMLIKFVPEILELIDIPEGLTGDKSTWKPEQVRLVGD